MEFNEIRDRNLQVLMYEMSEEIRRRKRGEKKQVSRVGQYLREQKERDPEAYARRLAYSREYKRRTANGQALP